MIDLQGVTKRYHTVTAVEDVSLVARPGQIVALLGPNGAGKTSLIRMIVGITLPDAGTVSLRVGDRPARRQDLGYLPEERGLPASVPISRTLSFYGTLQGLERRVAGARAQFWLERFELLDRARENVDALSKGNQQKVQLAACMLHEPALVVLDEPFSGLDPVNQELFIDLIGELRQRGATVLLSAHQMSLVERLADRVVFLQRGRVLRDGTLAELRGGAGGSEGLVSLHELYLRLAGADVAETPDHDAEVTR